jgi:hypothetical protein
VHTDRGRGRGKEARAETDMIGRRHLEGQGEGGGAEKEGLPDTIATAAGRRAGRRRARRARGDEGETEKVPAQAVEVVLWVEATAHGAVQSGGPGLPGGKGGTGREREGDRR